MLSLCILEPFRKNSRFWSLPRWAQLGWHTQCKAFLGGEHWTGLLWGLFKRFWKGMSLQISQKKRCIDSFNSFQLVSSRFCFPRLQGYSWFNGCWLILGWIPCNFYFEGVQMMACPGQCVGGCDQIRTSAHGKVINITRETNKQDSWNKQQTARGLIYLTETYFP